MKLRGGGLEPRLTTKKSVFPFRSQTSYPPKIIDFLENLLQGGLFFREDCVAVLLPQQEVY
jgi:hypothetical protein